jgi:hypothetical protein
VKLVEQFGKLLIAPPRDYQNEFERSTAGPAQLIECFEVVQASKQAPVDHQHPKVEWGLCAAGFLAMCFLEGKMRAPSALIFNALAVAGLIVRHGTVFEPICGSS